ncbi:GNAT family N-acetyltransferase [Novosphingobium beihaiensis]|uniref:GNAT family N-acetyltransferase n=1 Tax=Novosphingobium beihaiensis TaxID=2930389 RepID=A0ABT0BKE6_9SPHN|nr:GNAT family N-acetyltransferase [Novosphingobium beihaiensis]MCJ2185509.1 GNAT family N-acetyltransferase [Novosphingobium beihaiensis]
MNVRLASVWDIDLLVPLFDAYRQFYKQPSDIGAARSFLKERFEHQQSIILMAIEDGEALGFTQLYPAFSSTRLARTLILNDLFVASDARKRGVGRALLDAARDYGNRIGAVRLSLSTAIGNTTAQRVYEDAGWTRDEQFYAYGIALA